MVPGRGARQLTAKDGQHEGGVDPVASLGLDAVDCAAICDLGDLEAHVCDEGLDDGPRDGEGAGVGADDDGDEAGGLADHDGE